MFEIRFIFVLKVSSLVYIAFHTFAQGFKVDICMHTFKVIFACVCDCLRFLLFPGEGAVMTDCLECELNMEDRVR